MEADPRQCTETGALALRAIATTCSGGNKKGAHRAATGGRKGPNCFSENLRTCLGGRGIPTHRLRANSSPHLGAHGQMGQVTHTPYRDTVAILMITARRGAPDSIRPPN